MRGQRDTGSRWPTAVYIGAPPVGPSRSGSASMRVVFAKVIGCLQRAHAVLRLGFTACQLPLGSSSALARRWAAGRSTRFLMLETVRDAGDDTRAWWPAGKWLGSLDCSVWGPKLGRAQRHDPEHVMPLLWGQRREHGRLRQPGAAPCMDTRGSACVVGPAGAADGTRGGRIGLDVGAADRRVRVCRMVAATEREDHGRRSDRDERAEGEQAGADSSPVAVGLWGDF